MKKKYINGEKEKGRLTLPHINQQHWHYVDEMQVTVTSTAETSEFNLLGKTVRRAPKWANQVINAQE